MDRPFVMINMAMTADGKITSAAREYPRLTSDFDRRCMDRLRARADAILVGAGTLRADDPNLHVRDPELRRGKPAGLLKVLVTASGRISRARRALRDEDAGGLIVVTVEETADDALADLPAAAELWRIGRGRVDLTELLRRLKRRGVDTLLVEGGGELNWGFLRAGLLDELYVTIAPLLLGGRSAPTAFDGDGLAMDERVRLRLLDLIREGDELYCRYGVVR
jgi:2,5-diamino-6-(ribosylamino)-4(3H)-pyrimidinone 5'-phosphate reductase